MRAHRFTLEPEAKDFDCATIKSMSWRVPPGLLEQTFATGRAAYLGFLLDFGLFPDQEGAFTESRGLSVPQP